MKLREIRIEAGLSQKDLAKKLNVSPSNIFNYENGRTEPSIQMLSKIADALNISIDYLVGREDDFGNVVVPGQSTDLSKSDKELLDVFHSLGPFEQESIRIQIKALASARSEVIKK